MRSDNLFYHKLNLYLVQYLGHLEILKEKLLSGEVGEFKIAEVKVIIENEFLTLERGDRGTRIKKSIENYPTIYQRFYALYANDGELAKMGIWER